MERRQSTTSWLLERRQNLSSWLVLASMVLGGGVTVCGMVQTQTRTRAGQARNSNTLVQPLPPAFPQGAQAMGQNGFQLAAFRGAPPIITAGAVPIHPDRGACVSCHQLVGPRGNAIPAIMATSAMTHEYRGVCVNCHMLTSPRQMNMPPVMAMGGPSYMIPVAATANQLAMPYGMMPAAATATPPPEGEWLGLEVAPLTEVTARQYNIPPNIGGLVVAEAEGLAGTNGARAGDVVIAINGMPIVNMTDFFQATQNGTMAQGQVDLFRKGQRMSILLAAPTPAMPTQVAPPMNFGGAMPAAAMAPYPGVVPYPYPGAGMPMVAGFGAGQGQFGQNPGMGLGGVPWPIR